MYLRIQSAGDDDTSAVTVFGGEATRGAAGPLLSSGHMVSSNTHNVRMLGLNVKAHNVKGMAGFAVGLAAMVVYRAEAQWNVGMRPAPKDRQ
uniref:Uncharacterized protein n=1 Tax=Oryza rufipogon TaxID=4529 RepID=A0A0E0P794_ORYRU